MVNSILKEVRESAYTPVRSLRDQYAEKGKKLRNYNMEQMGRNLTQSELDEKRSLQEMATCGLFSPELSDAQLEVLEGKLEVELQVQNEFMFEPEKAAAKYRDLVKKLLDKGLSPDELKRYNQLLNLAQEGKLEETAKK